MGAVYQATDERTGQQVAIKVMRQEYTRSREALTRFFNEARAVNLIEHPVLVRIMEHAQLTGGLAYLVMEFLDGETLSARMRRYNGPMPEVEARRIVWLLAGALAAAHKKGIIHRGSEELQLATVVALPVLLGGIAGEACTIGPREASLLLTRTLKTRGVAMPAARRANA